MRVALLTIYIAAHLGLWLETNWPWVKVIVAQILPLVHARRLTGFGGSQLSHIVVAMSGYARLELHYPLDVEEVCQLVKESSMLFNGMEPESEKTTDGKVDPKGKHYSSYNYKGKVKLPGVFRGKAKDVTMGITDYEFFRDKKPKCGRREGRRHFFAQGSPVCIEAVIEAFKNVIPQTLWRDEKIPPEVHACKQWALNEVSILLLLLLPLLLLPTLLRAHCVQP